MLILVKLWETIRTESLSPEIRLAFNPSLRLMDTVISCNLFYNNFSKLSPVDIGAPVHILCTYAPLYFNGIQHFTANAAEY